LRSSGGQGRISRGEIHFRLAQAQDAGERAYWLIVDPGTHEGDVAAAGAIGQIAFRPFGDNGMSEGRARAMDRLGAGLAPGDSQEKGGEESEHQGFHESSLQKEPEG
jgi:hypothetical protein